MEITAEMVDAAAMQGARLAYAGAMRTEASAKRALASFLEAQAITAEEHASAVERGDLPIPMRPMKMVIAPDEAAADPEPEDEKVDPSLVQPIAQSDAGDGQRFFVASEDGGIAEGEDFTPEMFYFLDLFDDRLSGSKNFVVAVNEAAAAAMTANENTARAVAERIRELDEAAAARTPAPEAE